MALWFGETMTALRHLTANMAFDIGVTTGFVTGVSAATTPTGLAILVMPVAGSRLMTPTDGLPRRLFQITDALLRHLAILSGTLPMPVSETASPDSSSAFSYTVLAISRTRRSACSCV